jgi:hypothetical protein
MTSMAGVNPAATINLSSLEVCQAARAAAANQTAAKPAFN